LKGPILSGFEVHINYSFNLINSLDITKNLKIARRKILRQNFDQVLKTENEKVLHRVKKKLFLARDSISRFFVYNLKLSVEKKFNKMKKT